MDFPITVLLDRPVTHGDEEIGELTFDELTLRQSIDLEKILEGNTSANQQSVSIVAMMSGVDEAVILELRQSDYRKITKEVLEPMEEERMKDAGMIYVPAGLLEMVPQDVLDKFGLGGGSEGNE